MAALVPVVRLKRCKRGRGPSSAETWNAGLRAARQTGHNGGMPVDHHNRSLLDHDAWIMQQITNFMANDFTILDTEGGPIGLITTKGSVPSRLFMGSRELDVTELDGTPLVHVSDPPDFGLDTFKLTLPSNEPLASITKQLTFFKTSIDIQVLNGPPLRLEGDVLGFDFLIRTPTVVAARVSRQWAGLAAGLLGHSRYVVVIDPQAPRLVRLAIVGSLVVLDLIRAKADRAT